MLDWDLDARGLRAQRAPQELASRKLASMSLWFVFALMTAAAIFAVLLPLGRGNEQPAGGNEATVYRDQLAEIDRDLASGQIGATEAEAARVEIGRRLLAVADQERGAGAAESGFAPHRGGAGAGGPADRGARGLSAARFAQASRLSAGRARAQRRPLAAAGKSGRAGRAASGKEPDRRPRLERAGAGAVPDRPL